MSLILNESKITRAIDNGEFKQKFNTNNINTVFPLFSNMADKDSNEKKAKDEKALVTEYRKYSYISKVSEAVQIITNEAIVLEEEDSELLLELDLDEEDEDSELDELELDLELLELDP